MMRATAHKLAEVRETLKVEKNNFSGLFLLLSIFLLILIEVLIFQTKAGALIAAAAVLLLITLLKPKYLYFALIASFSIDGFTAFEDVSYPKIIAIVLILGLAIKMALTKRSIPEDSIYKFFYFFLAGSIVSLAFAKKLSVSVQSYITFVSLFLLFICTRYFLRTNRDIHSALNILFISALLTFAMTQIFGLSVRGDHSSRISSGTGDPNAFASYLLVLIPLIFYRMLGSFGSSRIIYVLALVGFLILVVFTGSRGGMLGFLGASAVLSYYYSIGRFRYIIFFCLILAAIFIFATPENYWERFSTIIHRTEGSSRAIDIRLENYRAAIKMIIDYPLAGVGLNNFRFISGKYGASTNLVVHNTYLEIFSGGGLLSFIPFSLILINSWRKLKLKKKYDENIRNLLICLKASFISILITLSFISGDHKKVLWFLLALISSAYYIAEEQKVARNSDGYRN